MVWFLYFVVLALILFLAVKLGFLKNKVVLSTGFFLLLWFSFYFVLAIPYEVMKREYDTSIMLMTILMVVVFLFFLLIGYFSKKHIPFPSFYSIDSLLQNKRTLSFLTVTYFLLFALYNYQVYGTLNFIESLTGLNTRRENTEWGGGSVYVAYYIGSLIDVFGVVLCAYWVLKEKFFISFCFALLVVCLSLQSGSKYSLVWLIYPLALYSYMIKKISILSILIPVFLTVFLVPVINITRHTGDINSLLNGSNDFLDILFQRADLFGGLYDLVQVLENGTLSHGLGITIFAVLGRFVPREYWPDRLGSTDAYLTEKIYHSSTWVFNYGGVGEFYFNFGFLGVVFIAFLTGFLLKSVDTLMLKKSQRSPAALAILMSSPFWTLGWGVGFNNFFFTSFIFWVISVVTAYVILSGISAVSR